MSRRRYNELMRLYSEMTEERLRAAHATATRIGSKKAAEHAAVIEELLDPVM